MSSNALPGVYYNEEIEYEQLGNGGKIPVIIGVTGNSGTNDYPVDGSNIQKFYKYNDVNKTIANGGIGTDTATNKTLAFLKDFFEESKITNNEQLGVPHVYVIDVGAGTDKNVWLTALTTAKTVTDATIEVYIGAEEITTSNYTLTDFIQAAAASIETETHDLDLRCGFFTKAGATDVQLIALNPTSGGILNSRIGLAEPDLFGKTMAMICCTPYYLEPGFLEYRTVTPGTFKKRTKEEALALQNAGIIFNRDEQASDKIYCRINRAVSTSFAKTAKPADSLFHARFNADNLLRNIFKAVYPQVKDNESRSKIVQCQNKVDACIDDEVDVERIIKYDSTSQKGTKLTLMESNVDPFDMELVGQIQPINATNAINVKAKIKNPS